MTTKLSNTGVKWIMNFSKSELFKFLDEKEMEISNAIDKCIDLNLVDEEMYLDRAVGDLDDYRDAINAGYDSIELRNSIRMTCKYATKVMPL